MRYVCSLDCHFIHRSIRDHFVYWPKQIKTIFKLTTCFNKYNYCTIPIKGNLVLLQLYHRAVVITFVLPSYIHYKFICQNMLENNTDSCGVCLRASSWEPKLLEHFYFKPFTCQLIRFKDIVEQKEESNMQTFW